MPTFKLPKPKKKAKREVEVAIASDEDMWRRRITIPANDAILDALAVDDEITVTLKGKVIGLRNVESKDYNDQNIEVEVSQVSAYPADSDAEEEEEGMAHGYNEG